MSIFFVPKSVQFQALLASRWTVDCLSMKLLRQGTDQVCYQGAGSIRQTADGQLEYVIYDQNTTQAFNFPGAGLLPGDYLGPDQFYRLIAISVDGNSWNAEWLDAGTDSFSGVPGVVVKGNIRELTCSSTVSVSGPFAILYAPFDGEIPANEHTQTAITVAGRESKGFSLNVWKASTTLGEIEVTKEGAFIALRFRGSGPALFNDVALRLEEAISVALGIHIRWAFEQTVSEGESTVIIRTAPAPPRRPRLGPPIAFHIPDLVPHAGKLFDRFLSHTVSTAPAPNHRYPLALSLLAVFRASAAAIEDEALMLSIEVEAIAAQYFTAAGKPSTTFVASVDDLMKHIRSWKGDQETMNRALGSVGILKGANASSALRTLAALGCIEDRHWKTWRGLRNLAAHGDRSFTEVRKLVTECNTVYQMLLLMVFQVVRYDGMFTDYTARGWPPKEAPALREVGNVSHTQTSSEAPFDPTSLGSESGEVT